MKAVLPEYRTHPSRVLKLVERHGPSVFTEHRKVSAFHMLQCYTDFIYVHNVRWYRITRRWFLYLNPHNFAPPPYL